MRLSELDYRVRRLQDAIAMQQAAPVDELSQSLFELGEYLTGLDELGLMAEAAELEIPVEALRSMASSYHNPFRV